MVPPRAALRPQATLLKSLPFLLIQARFSAGSSLDLVVHVGEAGRWHGLDEAQPDVRGQLLEAGPAIAEQDRDLVDDHLIEQTRGERRGHHPAGALASRVRLGDSKKPHGDARSVASPDTSPTTRLLHRLCRVVADRSRSQPARSARKCLLQPVIPGRSRLCRLTLYRPVTPEVAGSSPVAPVKNPCKLACYVVGLDARSKPTTQTFLSGQAGQLHRVLPTGSWSVFVALGCSSLRLFSRSTGCRPPTRR
jgi:hypothetical protein